MTSKYTAEAHNASPQEMDILQPFFTGDSYDTPSERRRVLGDRFFLNTRWYFVGGYLREVFRCRRLAVQGRYDKAAWAESSYRILRLIENCGGRFHVSGIDHLRACHPPAVIISNHMSTLETFVFPCIIAPLMDVTFVVKESLVTHPLFGPVMRSRDPIAVTRKNPRDDFQTVMSKGKELLSRGVSIVIFPQSTRSREFVPREFNSLGVKLAKAADVEVIPVAVKTDFWGNGRYVKDLGPIHRNRPIHIRFGPPFRIHGQGKQEHLHVIDFITEHIRQWGGIVEAP